jgi:uncharacterized membrane protein YphA (DoxX/SURF4 family)
LFLVLLRIAIGWHFLYEGTQKILSTPEGKASILAKIFPAPEGPPFSSEGYLRAASGPLAPKFRALVPDVDSREKLKLETIKAELSAEMARVVAHYGFEHSSDQTQMADAKKAFDKVVQDAEDWFKSTENVEKVKKYLDELKEIEDVENNPDAMAHERANALADRKVAEADRKALVKMVDSWTDSLRDALTAIAKKPVEPPSVAPEGDKPKEAAKDAPKAASEKMPPTLFDRAGPYKPEPPMTQLRQIDLLTMYGLTAVGLCLMLGLFTPLAALGGAAYLLGFYLSMPPWPGLPEGITEGHYRYVNKNLIEMLACLVLASTPNGLWIGLDALLFGWIGRGKRVEVEAPPAERPAPQDRRKFKNR